MLNPFRSLTHSAARVALLVAFALAAISAEGTAQVAAAPGSNVTVTVRVRHDSASGAPVVSATVRSDNAAARTDASGNARLQLAPGTHTVTASRADLIPASLSLELHAGRDTTVTMALARQAASLEALVVSATRSERRVEDTPLRVEVIDEEEIAEKVAMTPGDISMMLNETSGLRVQATNPSLGGANVRIQGLSGRYSLILADGLPLYGGQAGGLGLLQIPPVDLGSVEIIKGSASALYGSSALGGVINLVSRRPSEEQTNTLLVNQTTRNGTDGVAFLAGPLAGEWSYTMLAGAHRQSQVDLDSDRWTDMPAYERALVRPRLHYSNGEGRTAFLTGGFTAEDRTGGTMDGGTVPGGGSYVESLRTLRADAGGVAHWLFSDGSMPDGSLLTMRGSAMQQKHDHRFGNVEEDDTHGTWFGEAALAIPDVLGDVPLTWIAGAAYERNTYDNGSVAGMDYRYSIPSVFAQVDADPATWIALSVSARLDAHSEFGTSVNPRVSALLRMPVSDGLFSQWTTRLSAGTGTFAPTPFTDETEATGLTPLLLPAGGLSSLEAETARNASLDVGGPMEISFGTLEFNATAFGSSVYNQLMVQQSGTFTPGGASRLELFNSPLPTRAWGGELLLRLTRELGHGDASENDRAIAAEPEAEVHLEGDEDDHHDEPPAFRLTATYTYLRSSRCDPDLVAPGAASSCSRVEVPLTPRHSAGMVASIEQHGSFRVGLELYYTGRQALEDNPFRSQSRRYLIVGMLGERTFHTPAGAARVFLNLENIANVRQTRFDPLLLPSRGPGGRWTTDAWTELHGFMANAGVRWEF
ncbi:MAG TPA: TonB-dependent receptor [Gemmatimonadales bacterium]|nr:TonB-dependent receptor [Gemmatimonadales bacterium]